MNNTYYDKVRMWKKTCIKINHKLSITYREKDNYQDEKIHNLSIFEDKIMYVFFPQEQKIQYIKNVTTDIFSILQIKPFKMAGNLPYFNPDLSNFKKLVNKLKTYIILS